jgi:hypothetical protein
MARVIGILALGALLSGCIGQRVSSPSLPGIAEAHRNIERALPTKLSDRDGWTQDIYDGFTALGIEITPQNACAVAAVIAQESGFQVDPVVPGLG